MGRRGPPPTPTALKILRGNPGRRPLNPNEPQPERASPTCPEWMPPAGRTEWERIVPELDRLNMLTLLDIGMLEGLCNAYARAIRADKEVEERGITFTTDKGFVVKNPAVGVGDAAWDRYKKFCAEFGLTPASRSRIQVKPPEKPTSDKDFLLGKRSG